MRVAMQTNLMALIDNHPAFLGERLQRVAGNKEGGFDVVLIEQLQQTTYSNRPGKQSTGDVRCAIFTSITS